MIHSNCYPCGHFRLNQICLKQKKIHRDLCFEIRPEANLILEKTKKAAFPIKTAYKGRIPNYMSFRTETSSIYLNAINQYYCMEHTAFKIYTVYDHLPYYTVHIDSLFKLWLEWFRVEMSKRLYAFLSRTNCKQTSDIVQFFNTFS